MLHRPVELAWVVMTYQAVGGFTAVTRLPFGTMKHPVLLALGSFVLAGACWLAWAIYRDSQLSDGFNKIKTGVSKSEVSARLGKPKRVERTCPR